MRWVGLGYRTRLARWIESRPEEIDLVEITAEHFFDNGRWKLEQLRQKYPLLVHGLGLSLGTRGPLDDDTLERFAEVVDAARPLWVSEHVAFTRTAEADLGHLNPVPPTRENVKILAEHARRLSELCRRPLLLENIATHIHLSGEMSEPEFLNRVCEEGGCGLLLDVTNLWVNSRNHGFDPRGWLAELDRPHVAQLHAVGYTLADGRYQDRHAEAIQAEVWQLIGDVLRAFPVRALVLERDENFPPQEEIARELRNLKQLADRA